jgi:CBS-domain-containing membrane protein
MKPNKALHGNRVRPQGGRLLRAFSSILLALSLGLGSVLFTGCLAAPAVILTSAAVTTAALVSESEQIVQDPDVGNSAIVKHDTYGDSACRRTCQRHEAPPEEDQPGV